MKITEATMVNPNSYDENDIFSEDDASDLEEKEEEKEKEHSHSYSYSQEEQQCHQMQSQEEEHFSQSNVDDHPQLDVDDTSSITFHDNYDFLKDYNNKEYLDAHLNWNILTEKDFNIFCNVCQQLNQNDRQIVDKISFCKALMTSSPLVAKLKYPIRRISCRRNYIYLHTLILSLIATTEHLKHPWNQVPAFLTFRQMYTSLADGMHDQNEKMMAHCFDYSSEKEVFHFILDEENCRDIKNIKVILSNTCNSEARVVFRTFLRNESIIKRKRKFSRNFKPEDEADEADNQDHPGDREFEFDAEEEEEEKEKEKTEKEEKNKETRKRKKIMTNQKIELDRDYFANIFQNAKTKFGSDVVDQIDTEYVDKIWKATWDLFFLGT